MLRVLFCCWHIDPKFQSLSNFWVGLRRCCDLLFVAYYLLLLLIHVPSQKTSYLEENSTSFYTLRDQLLFCACSSKVAILIQVSVLTLGFLVFSLIGSTFTAVYVLQSVALWSDISAWWRCLEIAALVTLRVIPGHPDLSFASGQKMTPGTQDV